MACAWKGYYIQQGEQFPMEFTALQVQLHPGGLIMGEGKDVVGIFRIEGCFHSQYKICRFVKHYLGQHDVYYQGTYNDDGRTIAGCYGFEPADNDGAFQIKYTQPY